MKYIELLESIDFNRLKSEIVEWIRQWFRENGDGCNAVVGISGGKDSSVVAALCVEALGRERVIGVLMPNGEQADIADSEKLVRHLGIKSITVDISDAVNAVLEGIKYGIYDLTVQGDKSLHITEQTRCNLPPRIRMSTLYAISQSYNGRVANTCNLSEDWVGYSTRYGDSVGDFSPLSNLTTDEVIGVGMACGLPERLVVKTPSDGLCGKTDEDNLGFTYRKLNEYIRTGYCDDSAVKELIDKMHSQNMFKLRLMPSFKPENMDSY